MSFTDAANVVKASLDILDVVSRHVVLKKAGRNHLGLCPFHPEKTPSFNVNREKNLFKCFGCGESGDALTYGEVIRELAQDQGIQILSERQNPEEAAKQQDSRQSILSLNQTSQTWFQQQLASSAGEAVRQYLTRRNIDDALIQSFGLGFAPPGWENLTGYLMHQSDAVRANPSLLDEAGLANKRPEGGTYYDRFRNRLIIPIHDEKGQVVAFGGRALSDEDKPKYLNSPETTVYVKSRVLYGMHQAKEAIRQSKYAVVMEGYFDVISAHWAGIPQAVGSCGTALTDSHLKLLTRFGAETVYLAFDSDEAGLKAAMSAIELIEPYLSSSGLSLKIVVVPNGKDPDEFVRQAGARAHEAFTQLLSEAQSFLDFKFHYALRGLSLHNQEDRLTAVTRITPLLARIGQPVLRSEMLKRYADRLGVSEEALALEVKRYERSFSPVKKEFPSFPNNFSKKDAISKSSRRSYKGTQKAAVPRFTENISELRKPLAPKHIAAETTLLRLFFLNTESYRTMQPLASTLSFTHPLHQQLLTLIQQLGQPQFTLEEMIQTLHNYLREQDEPQKESIHALQRLVGEVALTADQLASQLRVEDVPPAQLAATLSKQVAHYTQVIQTHQQQEALKTLASKARQIEQSQSSAASEESSELSMLELQYEIREKLLKGRKEL
jgi:DNA primase